MVQEIEILSLNQFIEHIEENHIENDDLLFRGQREDWSLLPKLARIQPRYESSVLDIEKKMLKSFKLRAISHLEYKPENDWDWLSIAQHHGMATRLLDWTTNPLTALWFAVCQPATNEYGVVWVLQPSEEDHLDDSSSDPFNAGRTKIFIPKHISKRIAYQSACFTVHQFTKTGRFIKMENNNNFKGKLQKITIPSKIFPDLRFNLDRYGVNASTVYGDLEGLCRDAEWQYSLLSDEHS